MDNPVTVATETLPAPSMPLISLLEKVIGSGLPVEQFERALAVVERLHESRAREAFSAALAICQSEMPAVAKTLKNNQTGTMYAPLDAVIQAASPVWTRNGFAVSFSQAKPWKEGWVHFLMVVTHRDGFIDRREAEYPPDGEGPKGGRTMNPVQGVVSTGSYCQRDMLRLYFNIPLGGADLDGNNGDHLLLPEELHWIECMVKGIGEDPAAFCGWLEEGQTELAQIKFSNYAKAVDHLTREAARLKKNHPPAPKGGGK